jgi:hypothetical protein
LKIDSVLTKEKSCQKEVGINLVLHRVKVNVLILCFLQMFSDYQMQQMSENFIDTFGFNDDEFTESEEQVRYILCIPLNHINNQYVAI